MARWIAASGLSARRFAGVRFREVSVVEIREVLRAWLERTAEFAAVDDELVGAVVAAVRSSRRCGRRVRTGTGRRGRRCWPVRSRSAGGSRATVRIRSR